jgi:hypothetical protein
VTPVAPSRLTVVRPGARLLGALPSGAVQAVLAPVLRSFPAKFGMPRGGARGPAATMAYREAYPAADVQSFLRAWTKSRAAGMALALTYLARQGSGRAGGIARCDSEGGSGPEVIAFLHTSIDPVPVLSLLDRSRVSDYRWVMWPVHRGPETADEWKDERDFLLRLGSVSPELEAILLPVTTPGWLQTAIRHLRNGGRVLVAADAPFDGKRDAQTTVSVGQTGFPLAPTIELLARLGRAELRVLLPTRARGSTWVVDTRAADSAEELARSLSAWIAGHPMEWAGWPFIANRRRLFAIRDGTSASAWSELRADWLHT